MKGFEIVLISLLIGYSGLCAVPITALWFDPGTPVFANADEGDTIPLAFDRVIKRDSLIEYAVVIHRAKTNDVICDMRSGPFTYKAGLGPLVDKDLAWWTSENRACNSLKPGDYWAETTWTAVRPLGDLVPAWLEPFVGYIIPPKRVTRRSPLFTISRKDSK